LLYYIDNQNRCFVHAGFNRSTPFYSQEEYNYYLDRSLWMQAMALKNENSEEGPLSGFSRIYIGHTSTTQWNSTVPLKAFEIINLDTGAGKNGKLTIMNLDNQEFWQS